MNLLRRLSHEALLVSRSRSGLLTGESCIVRRKASRLSYAEYGPVTEVVKLEEFPDPKADESDDVVARVMMATVNPADFNTIEGTYPIRPKLPAVGGGEAIAVVESTGSSVTDLKAGDWVINSSNAAGTWTTHFKAKEKEFLKVSPNIPLEMAAMLRTNPGTAFRMLHDFVPLGKGDTFIQNGANSSCGQFAIQIAKAMGVTSVNVVRDREDIDVLKRALADLGADIVLTEEELRSYQGFKDGSLAKPKLALNCVGGNSSTEVSKVLRHGAVHVTYGGMSMKPVTAATSSLIFKDIAYRGFWYSRWLTQSSYEQKQELIDNLAKMVSDGLLQPSSHETFAFKDFKEAFQRAKQPYKKCKVLLDFR